MITPNRKQQTFDVFQNLTSNLTSHRQLGFLRRIIKKDKEKFLELDDSRIARDREFRFFTGIILAIPIALILWGIIILIIKIFF